MKKKLFKNEEVLKEPCKIPNKYLICAWKLPLNKGNYALKSFVKSIQPGKIQKKVLSLNKGNYALKQMVVDRKEDRQTARQKDGQTKSLKEELRL